MTQNKQLVKVHQEMEVKPELGRLRLPELPGLHLSLCIGQMLAG